jgi:hypothetical protein
MHRPSIHMVLTRHIHLPCNKGTKHINKAYSWKVYHTRPTKHCNRQIVRDTQHTTACYTYTISFIFAQQDKSRTVYGTLMKSGFKSLSSNMSPILVINMHCVKTKIHWYLLENRYQKLVTKTKKTLASSEHVIYTINTTHYSKICHTDKPIKL